jgi:streptogrisin D
VELTGTGEPERRTAERKSEMRIDTRRRRLLRRTLLVAAVGVFAPALAASPMASARAAAADPPTPAADCTHHVTGPIGAAGDALQSQRTPSGEFVGDTAAVAISRVAGTDGGVNPDRGSKATSLPFGLDRGVLGVTGDVTMGFKVVVDRRMTDPRTLSTMIKEAVPAAAAGAVVVEESCVPAARVAAAWRSVTGRGWHPDAPRTSLTASLDAATEKIRVTIDPDGLSPAVLEALAGIDRDVLAVEVGQVGRASRLNDASPHKGGARVINQRTGGICTSGFHVRRSDGVNAATTASHCGLAGDYFYSGPYAYGRATTRTGYPTWDVMLLINGIYTPTIYTDGPDESRTVRTVAGAADPVVGQLVCVSGQTTRAHCRNVVQRLDATFCVRDECTYLLMQTYRPGWVPTGGDSGAPVYTISSVSARHAIARGSHVGDDNVRAYHERWNSIATHLGVRIVTG